MSKQNKISIPAYRLAHQNPDWSNDAQFYDCLTMPLDMAMSLLDKADGDILVHAAKNELNDMHAIIDAWFERNKTKATKS